MDIQNKVVLITGASAGIGLATARRFARAGAKLALVARSGDRLERLAADLRQTGVEAVAIQADLRDPAQVEHMVSETKRHYGRIDVLINNAGQAAAGMVADMNLEDFRSIIDLNVLAPLIAMQAAIPIMREQCGGIIINVSSMVTKMHIPGLSAYAATKAALNMLTDTARAELAAENIRVINIFPRMTDTDFGKNSIGSSELRLRQRVPPGVPIDPPEHVAERILEAAVSEVQEQYMDG